MRITTYHPDIVEKVEEYLTSCIDTIEEFHKTRGQTSDSFSRHINVNLPTVEGLARYINTHTSTIRKWVGLYPEFDLAIQDLLDGQRDRLIQKGLGGDYSAVIAKQLLSGLHGIRESSDVTSNGKELQVSVVNYADNPTS